MKKSLPRKSALNRKLISLAVASCFAAELAFANPTAPTVVSGSAAFQQAGNLLSITNSPNAIINWGSFSIGASEITRFIQQSQASAVLNRVIGQDPSSILGALQSNGRVFLINPNGILFGAGAQIDVAGLVASTLNLSNADFLAGKLKFTEVPGAGSIVNQGNITTAQGGNVYLVAPDITNSGIITSPKGEVVLAAGKSVELVNPGTPNLRVEITAPDNEARNLGQIVADSGRIGIYAGLINHSGTIRADTVEVGANGEILLKASKNITLEPGSVISASGAPGGVHDGGTVRIVADGTLDMQPGSEVHVDGGVDGGNGGFLELSGKQYIALNGEFTGRARKEGYKNGTLLLDPANINITVDLSVVAAIPSVSGSGAMPVVVSPDGSRIYVGGNGLVTVIDATTNTVVTTIPVGGGGNNNLFMGIKPDGSRLYVVGQNLSGNGTVSVIDTSINAVIATPASSSGSNHVFVKADGTKVYITNGNTTVLTVLDTATNTTSSVTVGVGPSASAVTPAGTRLYVSNGSSNSVSVVDTGTNSVVTTISTNVGSGPLWVAISPDGTRAYTANIFGNSVTVIDTATNTVVTNIGVGTSPVRLLVSADSSRLYVLNQDSNSVSVINTSINSVIATVAVGAAPREFALSPDGSRIYVASTSANNVAVISTASNSVVGTVAVGTTPFFAVPKPDSSRVYVGNRTTGSVSVISNAPDTTGGDGVVLSLDSVGATLNIAPAALNGGWTNVSLAATNNINVLSPITNSDLPTGSGTFSLIADNDINVNALIGTALSPLTHPLFFTAGRTVAINSDINTNNTDVTITANNPAAVALNRGSGAGGITMASGTTLNAGTGTVALTVGAGPGAGTSGNLVVENITAANVNLQQEGQTNGSSILRASASSLIQATNLLMEVDLVGTSGTGVSIGTSSEPMRVAVTNLEAHTHEASSAGGGIFIDSPTQGLTIGGVPFFSGLVKGVQNVTSGDITINSVGNITTQAGGASPAGCGLTGGTGGPVCAFGNIVMRAGWDGNTATPGVVSGTGSLSVNQNISAQGNIDLFAGKDISVASSTIQMDASSSTITLNAVQGITVSNSTINAGLLNPSVALSTTGPGSTISISNNSAITATGVEGNASVSVSAPGGITVSNSTLKSSASSNAATTVMSNAGSILVDGASLVKALGNNANVALNGASGVTVSGSSLIHAEALGVATVDINAINTGAAINVSASTVEAIGKDGFPGGSATVNLMATGAIAVDNSGISAQGGNGLSTGFAGGTASMLLQAGSAITVTGATTAITATGGSGAAGSDSASVSGGAGGAGGSASVSLMSVGTTTIAPASISATGGNAGIGGNGLTTGVNGGNGGAGGTASVTLISGNQLTQSSGSILAFGGNGGAGGSPGLGGSPGNSGVAGIGTALLEVSTASGNIAPSGDIIAENIVADNVELQQNSSTSGKSILRASSTSLITANQLLMEVDLTGGTSGGSIGTAGNTLSTDGPMRVQVSNVEAHTHQASPGIFIESPNAGNLQIGGVSFFGGSVKGVQNVTSGDISIGVNGTLTMQPPDTGPTTCGALLGGPVCTASGNITLRADDMSIGHSVSGTGTVTLAPFSTNRNINIELSPTPNVLSLTPTEMQKVTGSTLEIGRLTDTGSLHVSTPLATPIASSDINTGTLRLQHQNVFVDGKFGSSGAEFNHNLEIKAIDTNTIQNGANILLADNNNLLLSVGTNPVGPSLTLGGGTLATTIQVGTTASNTGSMTLQGRGVVIGASGTSANTIVQVLGSGAQTITSTGDVSVTASGAGSNVSVLTGSGTQTIDTTGASTGSGVLLVQGSSSGGSATVQSQSGSQSITLKDGLTVQSGSASSANAKVLAATGQTISAKFVDIFGEGASQAIISNLTSGTQSVTTSGMDTDTPFGRGIAVVNHGSGAITSLANNGTGAQLITVNNADRVRVHGLVGNASIGSPNGDQTIVVQGATSLNRLDVGGPNDTGFSAIGGNNQSITVGQPGQNGLINVRAGVTNAVAIISNSSGTQTITTAGTIALTGGTATGGTGSCGSAGACAEINNFSSATGTQTVSAHSIILQGGSAGSINSGAIFDNGSGSQIINITGTGGSILLQGGSGSGSGNTASINVSGSGDQQINFTASGGTISLTGGTVGTNNSARIRTNNGNQTISGASGMTLTGGASGGGVDATNNSLGNSAQILSNSGSQNISVGANGITMTGGGGTLTDNFALIIQGDPVNGAPGTSQTITLNNGGAITLQGGSSAQTNVIGGTSNPNNFFRGSYALIESNGDSQQLSFSSGGAINLTGGTVGSNNAAQIFSRFGTQTITGAPSISLTGGANGGSQNGTINEGNFARISANVGDQSIAAGAITATGGANGTNNSAQINENGASATQTVSASGISLTGGADGGGLNTGDNARIRSAGSQSISVGSGGLSLIGGGGSLTDNFASVFQAGLSGTSQSITVNGGGTITLQGGSSAQTGVGSNHGSFAFIRGDGDSQTISFASGGAINITGGTVGSHNNAGIRAANGAQTVLGSPNVTMISGASGGISGEGNFAIIEANNAAQSLTLGTTQLTGGAGGVDNFSVIEAPTQNVTINGALTLTGSSGGSPSAGSRIGGFRDQATSLALTVHGGITLSGGAVTNGGSALGPSLNSATPQTGNVTVSADGDITLNGGTVAGTRIGQPAALVGGGDVSVTAGGDITLGGNATTGGSIRTTGNVTLHADASGKSISQPAGTTSTIIANTLTATANADITLSGANDFNQVSVGSATSVTLNDVNAIVLNGVTASGALSVTAAGAITQTAPLMVGGASSFSAGANPITLTDSGNDFTGAVSLNNSGANNVAVTAMNAIVLGTSSVGSGTLTVTSNGAITQTGALTQAAGAGLVSIGAGASDITLTNAGNDFTGVVATDSTGNVTITDANSFIINGGVGGSTTASFTLNANGAVSQSSAFTSAPAVVVINAGIGPIVLNNPGNNFTGNVSIAANTNGAASFVNTNAAGINLAASTVGGALSLTSGGPITQAGAITVGGSSTINAGANPITLTNSGNHFTGAVSLSNSLANDAAIVSSGTLNLGASSVGRDLTASASGAGSNLNLSGAGTVGGSASLSAGNDVNLNAGLTAGSNLTLAAGSHVRVSDAIASAGGAVNVSAGFLDITATSSPAQLQAGTNLAVAVGDISLQGGSGSGASAELRAGPGTFSVVTSGDGVVTSGNVVLSGGGGSSAFARIFGNPDVNMTVGGVVQMNAGSGTGAFARIEAASPTSINIIFPNLASGGFFVNGVEGVVSSGSSGFFAGGVPAVPGVNFNVTFSLAPLSSGATSPSSTVEPTVQSDQISATQQVQQTVQSDQVTQQETQAAIVVQDEEKKEQQQVPPLCR